MPLTKDRLELLVAHSTDIIVATDRKGRVVYYNDGATLSLGYTEDEITGVFVAKLYVDLDEAKRVMAAMRSPVVAPTRSAMASNASDQLAGTSLPPRRT